MSKTLIIVAGLICAIALFALTSGTEPPMSDPKKPQDTEEGAGVPTPGETPQPSSDDTPEQTDRIDQEAEIGMPMTPEELRRLKEEADRPDPDAGSDN